MMNHVNNLSAKCIKLNATKSFKLLPAGAQICNFILFMSPNAFSSHHLLLAPPPCNTNSCTLVSFFKQTVVAHTKSMNNSYYTYKLIKSSQNKL